MASDAGYGTTSLPFSYQVVPSVSLEVVGGPSTPEERPKRRRHGALRAFAGAAALASLTGVGLLSAAGQGPGPGPAPSPTERRGGTVLVTGFAPFHGDAANPSGDAAKHLDGVCIDMNGLGGGVDDLAAALADDGGPPPPPPPLPPLLPPWPDPLCFRGLVLPVDHAGASAVADELDAFSYRAGDDEDDEENGSALPRAIIHLGYESVAKGLKLELVAANVRASETNPSDSCGHAGLEPLVDSGQGLLATTAPLDSLSLEGLRRSSKSRLLGNLTEVWSRDAGAYYCNEVYYRTLSAVRGAACGEGEAMLPAIFVHCPPPSVASTREIASLVVDLAVVLVGGRGGRGERSLLTY